MKLKILVLTVLFVFMPLTVWAAEANSPYIYLHDQLHKPSRSG